MTKVAALVCVVSLLALGLGGCSDESSVDDRGGEPVDDAAESEQSSGSDVAEGSADAAAWSCLPMDPGGWRQAEHSLPDDVELTSNDDAIVAMTKFGSRFHVWSSEDGLTWEAAASTPDVVLSESAHAVAGGTRGFVAVATTGRGELPLTPVIVFSPDGTTWEHVDAGSLPTAEVRWLTDVFAGPDGFVVVGTSAQDWGRFVWFSGDGREWTETSLSAITIGGVAVTATESGWAALLETDSWSPVRVWISADGLEWAEVDTDSSPPGWALWSYMWTPPFTVLDDAWVLALDGATDDAAQNTPTVWVSTDDGRTWSEHTVWDDPDRAGFTINDVAITESGLLVAGYQDRPGRPGVEFVHHSSDGMSWRHCWDLEIQAIEPFGEALVAVTGVGTVHVWNAEPG